MVLTVGVSQQEDACDVIECVSSPGDPDPGPQAEPGFRSRGPGPEEPAAGEGEDVALIGGNQVWRGLIQQLVDQWGIYTIYIDNH